MAHFVKELVMRSRDGRSSTMLMRSYLIAAFSRNRRGSLSRVDDNGEEIARMSFCPGVSKESRLIQGARNVVGSYIAV
jgi:hypothetical protein